MSSSAAAGSRIPFGHQPFLLYFCARGLSEFSYQIAAVAVGWQIYALTNSAFDLGMVGLAQFIPTMVLIFAAGHVADRYDRKRVAQICQIVAGLTAAFLAWATLFRMVERDANLRGGDGVRRRHGL
jgi:MFS family permease